MGECLIVRRGGESYRLPVLDSNYPKDVSTTVIKGNNASATFSVVISEPGSPAEYTYQWYVDGNAVSGATGSSYTKSGLSTNATYTVRCSVTNKKGTVESRVATLNVVQHYTPTLNPNYPQDATVVKGTSVKSEVRISASGNSTSYTYQWYKDDSPISGATSPSYNFTPTVEGTTTVYCAVTNSAGIVTSRTATITATEMYLYNDGNQYTSITGGWIKNESDISITFNSNSIDFADVYGTTNKAAMFTSNKIDVTKYSRLIIKGSTLDNISIGVTSSNNTSSPTFIASSTSTELDISTVSGSFYVCVAATAAPASAKITKIYLV